MYPFQQLLLTNLFLSPVWIVGLIELFRNTTARFLAWTYVVLIVLMIVSHGKHYYPGDVYPIVIAAGGVAVARWTQRLALVRVALVPATIVAGLFFLPFSLPVLSETQMVGYQQWVLTVLHLSRSTMATEHGQTAQLPTDWADMHGWPEMTATIASIYDALPAGQRSQAVIVASNYGEAGAVARYGGRYHLPAVYSGQNQLYFQGHPPAASTVAVIVGGQVGRAQRLFRSCQVAGRLDNDVHVDNEEQGEPIAVCRGPIGGWAAVWPQIKHED
jgi:hypothetical protein